MKNDKENKDVNVQVRFTRSEVKKIKENAKKLGISMSDYIRISANNCEIKIVSK